MRPLVISYARFSSAGQAEGTSLQRQLENAEKYAAANGLVIDHKHSLSDAGVSGFDGSNIRQGALGLFLRAVEDGKIPRGSTLIVESFDRMSRAKPIDALGVFTDIIRAGITIVTLTTPPKTFSRASIDDNVFQLMEALIDMYRAHGESARKSDFGQKNWEMKKRRAIEDGVLLSAKAPHWITVTVQQDLSKSDPNKRKAALNVARASVALKIIEWAEQGIGNATIIRRLNEGADREKPWSKRITRRSKRTGAKEVDAEPKPAKWEPSYVQKMLTNPALYGAIDLDGELVEGYYPPLIDRPRYERLQLLRSARATTKNVNRKGKSVTNLFSGLLKCGYCGSAMNVAGYKVLKGRQAGYERKYVACHGARIGATQCKMHMWFMDELEQPLLLALWKDVDYSTFEGTADKSELEKAEQHHAFLQAKVTELQTKIENGNAAILDSPGLKSLKVMVEKMETELEKVERELKEHKHQLDALHATSVMGTDVGVQMQGLANAFMATIGMVPDELELRSLREQISTTVHQSITKIVMYPVGRTKKSKHRSVEVTFRTGDVREIELPKVPQAYKDAANAWNKLRRSEA